MNGSPKAPRRPASASTRKTAAKPAVAKAEKQVPAEPAPVAEERPAMTDADLAASQETQEKPSVPVQPEETVPPAIVETTETVEIAAEIEQKGNEIMPDVIETTKKYTDEAKERLQSAFSEMSEKAKANVEKSTKAFEELSDLAKGNVEALVESGKIATKGVEALGQDAAEYGRASFEKASAAMKSLAAVKSPTEFFQLQSDLLSTSFDIFAKESAKTSEALLKLAGDVVQPISTRVSVVTEKVRSFAA